ncbi:Dsim\GD20331-PA-like protein [Anopheles sinensis]|uniref:Dsim\GD20331-PA-like protein n=1 Tax=Anopheles sinensis TaxID=74873 RepID=A0A084WRD8_ANOSI|nr:Dsim\GD20331-PA-like protein [Anopheles sinensis]
MHREDDAWGVEPVWVCVCLTLDVKPTDGLRFARKGHNQVPVSSRDSAIMQRFCVIRTTHLLRCPGAATTAHALHKPRSIWPGLVRLWVGEVNVDGWALRQPQPAPPRTMTTATAAVHCWTDFNRRIVSQPRSPADHP